MPHCVFYFPLKILSPLDYLGVPKFTWTIVFTIYIQKQQRLLRNSVLQLSQFNYKLLFNTSKQRKISCLENPMDGGAWQAAVHGVPKSRVRLSDFTFTFHFHALEKEMATHSSVLAWRIPGTGEPEGLPSLGSHRVGHN